jgi:hypothetical protein
MTKEEEAIIITEHNGLVAFEHQHCFCTYTPEGILCCSICGALFLIFIPILTV